MLRIATLNVYWFGLLKSAAEAAGLNVGFHHTHDDDHHVTDLVLATGANLVAFQEIVDVHRLERALATLPGRWRARDTHGGYLASDAPRTKPDANQHVVIAWNEDAIELVHWDRPIKGSPRKPVCARFRTGTGEELTVVAVHPKSGVLRGWELQPPNSSDHKSGERRRELFEAVAAWLAARPAGFDGPNAVLLGDFNSVADGPETAALRGEAFAGWSWSSPEFSPADADRRTTKTDPEIIDHIVISPALEARRKGPARALAFDLDSAFPTPADPAPRVWKRTTDHRPVWVDIDV